MVGVTVFMLGIKLMGDALKAGAGKTIKVAFAKIGDNRFYGVGIGTAGTVALQSSTTTTVMVVGFVNAGVMTLMQASAIMMGANVGTTLTAFLGVLGNLPVANVFMAAGFFGVFMYMFSKNTNVRRAGKVITALAILFAGMNLMSTSLRGNQQLMDSFSSLFVTLHANPAGPLLLILFGTLFTALIQSSSASTLMAVDLAAIGVIPLPAAIMILVGANIGTTFTAIIASLGTTKNAQRAAVFHFVYNIIGALLFVPVLWPLSAQISNGLLTVAGGNTALAAAFFHLFYNLSMLAVLIMPLPLIVKLIMQIIPIKEGEEGELKLQFIVEGDEPSREAAVQEVGFMASLVRQNMKKAVEHILEPNEKTKNTIISTEQKINFINKAVQNYLVKIGTPEAKRLHMPASELERIGDYAMELVAEATEMTAEKVVFSEDAKTEFCEMATMIDCMFEKSMQVFSSGELEDLEQIAELEAAIDKKKHVLSFKHIKRLNQGECSVEGGVHFYAAISSLERVSNFLANIAYSIKDNKRIELARIKQLNKQNTIRRKSKTDIYW
jgi:phosphate:Na+ symporter